MLWAVHSGCSNGIWMPWSGLRLPASDMLTLKTWRVQMLQNNSRAFDLSTFSVRRPSPIHSYSLPASVCLTLSPHTHRHGEHPLSLFGAHEVPHLKYAFLPPGNARREKREPTYVCVCESVCGVGVENVFWQVSLMRSFYEICKPGNPTPSPPSSATLPIFVSSSATQPSLRLVVEIAIEQTASAWAESMNQWAYRWGIESVRVWEQKNMENERGCN